MAEEKLSWGDPGIGSDEVVTAEDVKSAEAMGKMPVGKFLCTCVDSQPKQKDFANYSCIAASLKWRVDKVIELDGAAVAGDEGDNFVDRFIYDDVNMASPDEKDGMKKRRILIAKRTGLITDAAGTITSSMWANGIIGKQAIITNEDQHNEKTGKTYRNVAFNGYEAVPDSAKTPEDSFSDI